MKILRIGCVFSGFLSLILSLSAQTFHSFGPAGGCNPEAALVQAFDGNLYGTAHGSLGRAAGEIVLPCNGAVFKITPSGTLTGLYVFGTDTYSALPSGLVQATDGNFYGTTNYDAANFDGTVFKITPSGTLTTLYTFCSQSNCTDGALPYAGLVQAPDGNFYGTTGSGGANGDGTVFKITPKGTLTTLHSFDGTDGALPYAGLIQATDGQFYGTTGYGGISGKGCSACGTVFKITPSGRLTTLHRFDGTDGALPYAELVQANDGNFYGTTGYGGTTGLGTVFKITPGGRLTTLYSFCSQCNADGYTPVAALIQATDGKFYGSTSSGADNLAGTVFKITPSGMLTTLYRFCSQGGSCMDGANPNALTQDTNGNFYGTTGYGGPNNAGTAFSLSVGLGPFVETSPTFGKAGAAVKILGTDLTGAASVTFNGTAANFTVVSKSEIKTSVPEGATTGRVEVNTPKRMLKSNVVFRVTK